MSYDFSDMFWADFKDRFLLVDKIMKKCPLAPQPLDPGLRG